jgi:glycerol uptake facilitator-like aquaporin
LLGETIAAVGAVFAVFGVYLLIESKPSTASDGRLARLLLQFLDPTTASLVANYLMVVFGTALVLLGLYVRIKAKA